MMKKTSIMADEMINSALRTISFILIRAIVQTTSEITYPARVAMAAPSIPMRGIRIKFSKTLHMAPPARIRMLGQVFFMTKN